MSLVHWDHFRDLEDVSHRLNRLFSRSTLPTREGSVGRESLTLADWTPPVDISETPKEYLIKAEVPAVAKDNVKVMVQDGVLSIRGERKQETEDKYKKYHRVERSYGSFFRSFAVPDDVDDAAVNADFTEGILNIHLPKSKKAKPKSIEVSVA